MDGQGLRYDGRVLLGSVEGSPVGGGRGGREGLARGGEIDLIARGLGHARPELRAQLSDQFSELVDVLSCGWVGDQPAEVGTVNVRGPALEGRVEPAVPLGELLVALRGGSDTAGENSVGDGLNGRERKICQQAVHGLPHRGVFGGGILNLGDLVEQAVPWRVECEADRCKPGRGDRLGSDGVYGQACLHPAFLPIMRKEDTITVWAKSGEEDPAPRAHHAELELPAAGGIGALCRSGHGVDRGGSLKGNIHDEPAPQF